MIAPRRVARHLERSCVFHLASLRDARSFLASPEVCAALRPPATVWQPSGLDTRMNRWQVHSVFRIRISFGSRISLPPTVLTPEQLGRTSHCWILLMVAQTSG